MLRLVQALVAAGVKVYLSELIDYELRRELLRASLKTGQRLGLDNLDGLAGRLQALPVTAAVLRQAAELWAQARNKGKQTAADEALDMDMILCAHALQLEASVGERPVIATSNTVHLALFADARDWQTIQPPP